MSTQERLVRSNLNAWDRQTTDWCTKNISIVNDRVSYDFALKALLDIFFEVLMLVSGQCAESTLSLEHVGDNLSVRIWP